MTQPHQPPPDHDEQDAPSLTGDPFLDEVRALKHDASARCGHDLNRILEEIREIEKRRGNSVLPAPAPVLKPGKVA